MNRHLRSAVAWLGLTAALPCLLCQLGGCQYVQFFFCGYADWSSYGSRGGGEPGTKYFVLFGPPVRFQASPWGLKPELAVCPHNLYSVSLDQFEMNFGDLRGWIRGYFDFSFVAVKHVNGRCAEIAIYCQGVIYGRYAFEYDDAGRARRRVGTEYEGCREGEGAWEWKKRMWGQTPPVACVSEIEYAWSADGRTVEVTRRVVHGKRPGRPPIDLPDTDWDEPGHKLETWKLNTQGLITSVLRDGKWAYSAQYDDAGRLLTHERKNPNGSVEKVENQYDTQGRLVETRVKYGDNRTQGIFVHAYPGGPRVDLPPLKEPGDAAWVVTHDQYGRVSRIREKLGPSDDLMSNTFDEFRRDKDGRIIWFRRGFAR